MAEPQNPPMGRLDAFDVGDRKLTVQTEFLSRPSWHVETKVYLGGELKKVYSEPFPEAAEPGLQKFVNDFHHARVEDIVAGLRARKN